MLFRSLQPALIEFDITTARRMAPFLGEVAYESSGLTRMEESFAYTPERLTVVWPFRFKTLPVAEAYVARGAAAIASYVYANRMGNGAETSGDGWRFRGRGFIQLTGRANYAESGVALDLPLLTRPEMAADPANAWRIAARFFATRGCNGFADAGNFSAITYAINGGSNGAKGRADWRRRFTAALATKNEEKL